MKSYFRIAALTMAAAAIAGCGGTPNLWYTQEDINKLLRDIKTYPAAKENFDHLIKEADGWLDGSQKFMQEYPDIRWDTYETYPKRPMAWGGRETKDWWEIGFGVHDLGFAYSLTGKKEYLDQCRKMLCGLAGIYHHYPQESHGARHDASKVFVQRLDEAMWGIDLAFGYSCIRQAVNKKDRQHIEGKLLGELVKSLYRYKGQGANNYTCVMDECAAAVGFACQDKKWQQVALEGYHKSCGFKYLVDNWIEDDGSTKEGAMGYHLMGMRALIGIAEAFRVGGQDIYGYNHSRIKKAMDFIVSFVYPNHVSPATHDGGNLRIASTTGACIYENMYLRFSDEVFLQVIKDTPTKLHSSQGCPEPSRFYEPVKAGDLADQRSMNFEHIGMSVLRSGKGLDQAYVLLDYGKFDFHGHLDKLQIITFHSGEQMGLDPGSFNYANRKHKTWSIQTASHNTVCVDGKSQAKKGGALALFDTTDHNCQVMRARGGPVYKGVTQFRTIALCPEYIIDIFELNSKSRHTYDWLYHNEGRLTHRLSLKSAAGTLGKSGGYQHIQLKAQGAQDRGFKVTFAYKNARVNLHLAGQPGTQVIVGEGLKSRNDSQVPMIAVRRQAKKTCYTAVHGFYKKGASAPVKGIKLLPGSGGVQGVKVIGPGFTDIFAVANKPGKHTVKDQKRSIKFDGWFYYQRTTNEK